ncbi:MAG: hypothetical protein ABGX90_17355, partial [Brachybacterium sp.]|uniref:hypothetical protein n=1 Tax=Brachybacterium sp. TaxID=1891286 RepID=UPI003241CF79
SEICLLRMVHIALLLPDERPVPRDAAFSIRDLLLNVSVDGIAVMLNGHQPLSFSGQFVRGKPSHLVLRSLSAPGSPDDE